MTAESGSLASVFGAALGEDHHGQLLKWRSRQLKSDRLAQLHAKFWGKSMASEEEEWRKSHPPPSPSTGSLEHEGQGGDDNMDEGGDEGRDEDKGMDGDEEMHEGDGLDKDDDVIPGCYMLDIGIKGLEIDQLWIRAEYIRIFDYIEVFFKEPGFPPGRPPGAVIIGQQGIGKSVWVFYALRRYLAEKKPVIWYRDQRCYLFVNEGVYESPPDYKASYFVDFVRTLVDPDESPSGVPERLVGHGTRHSVIYTTSPPEKRWKRLHKTVRVIRVIMNPWVRKEMLRAAQGLYPGIKEERINDVFDRFGPIPRLCIDYSSNPKLLNDYAAQVQHTISSVTIERLERWFIDAYNLNMDSNFHKICLLSRESGLPGRGYVVAPITRSIEFRLTSQMRELERADQIRLYKRFLGFPALRVLAGILFEAAGQDQLRNGINLDIIPMVKVSQSQDGTPPQWHFSHLPMPNESLENSRQLALLQQRTIVIPGAQVIDYGDGGPSSITPNALYLPKSTNQMALDSFMLLNDLLYIFQFTIGEKDDIKLGFVDSLGKRPGLPPMDRWRFVFLMEPNQYLECPQPQSLKLRQLSVFSAVISLEKVKDD